MFVDRAEISVKAGDGGNGCCSFHHEKYVPRGGPDGGDGGGGGHVIIEASLGEQSLEPYSYNRHYQAPNGPGGRGSDMHGRKADDIVLKVPVGTVITDAETGEQLADLDASGARVTAAIGGRGGRGNPRFATQTNRAPREWEPGFPGERRLLTLELKTMADAGLVGYPNAGKSTLLRAISAARPKVAPYPFTTLHPVVGVVEMPDFSRLTVADIPGLIDGAHDNVGLGHSFLRHIERTHVLVFVLDMAGVDGRTPWEDLRHLREELDLYMPGLSKRPAIIVANKMDLPEAEENLELLKSELVSEVIDVIPVAAAAGELDGFKEKLAELVKKTKTVHFDF
ncbi:MAG: GTPase ObgE [Victivallaceae bacterium]|nr:GTPase ObgE [Victivallaceae bacterium]